MANRRWIVSAGLALMIIAGVIAAWNIVLVLPGYHSYASATDAPAATRLNVQSQDATIILQPGSGHRVRVSATGKYSSHRPLLSAHTANSETRVIAQCQGRNTRCNLTIRIGLPANLDVTAHSDDGMIQARQLTGSLRLSTINGDIDVSGSSGPLSLQTQNSGIYVERSRSRRLTATSENGGVTAEFDVPPDLVSASSQNGTVDLTVPSQESYAVDTHTTNGHSDVGVPNSATATRKLIATTVNADVVVQYGR